MSTPTVLWLWNCIPVSLWKPHLVQRTADAFISARQTGQSASTVLLNPSSSNRSSMRPDLAGDPSGAGFGTGAAGAVGRACRGRDLQGRAATRAFYRFAGGIVGDLQGLAALAANLNRHTGMQEEGRAKRGM